MKAQGGYPDGDTVVEPTATWAATVPHVPARTGNVLRLQAHPRERAPAGMVIRAAVEEDQDAIRELVRGERLNPNGLDWPNFMVAANADGLAGAAQLRKHADGARELGSLVVAAHLRGHRIAARLIDALLARERGAVHMITGATHAAHYRRWGFCRIEISQAPWSVRINYLMGRLARVISYLKGHPPRQLVILGRPGVAVVEAARPDPGARSIERHARG